MSDEPTTPPVPRDAPAPFSAEHDPDNHRPADFILRSCDGVDFFVHKDMLRITSEFFDSLFAIPRPNPDTGDLEKGGLTVLELAETSDVLYRLLSLAYPAKSGADYTSLRDIDVFFALHGAAQKYQFPRVLKLLREMLDNHAPVGTHPHRLFAIGRLLDLPSLARKAALYTLELDPTAPRAKFPEMKLITWETIHALLDFHHACGSQAEEILVSATGPRSFEGGPNFRSSNYRDREHENPLYLVYDQSQWPKKTFVWWDSQANHGDNCGPRGPSGDLFAGKPRNLTLNPADWFRTHIDLLVLHVRLAPSHHVAQLKAVELAESLREAVADCPACSELADGDLTTFAHQLKVCIEESNMKFVENL
ncbi:hypothetical protein FB45DRAFT_923321 [Roridomyces roridus]|uniref:BTB domain-containing protein n=1 Tax=Roridomyces roridus TaxID=1738132 RepID=A0AAD7FJV3_9AGAR|nr:hypothetical protein FB45DRAFT_923321 [Roridomyces roridus]